MSAVTPLASVMVGVPVVGCATAGIALVPTATTALPASTASFPAIPLRNDFLSNGIGLRFLELWLGGNYTPVPSVGRSIFLPNYPGWLGERREKWQTSELSHAAKLSR